MQLDVLEDSTASLDRLFENVDLYLPPSAWAQTLVALAVVLIAAVFAQWVVARLAIKLTRGVLHAAGRDDWDQALSKRRAYRFVRFTLPFLVIYLSIRSVPNIDPDITTFLARFALVLACFFVIAAVDAWLSALQDTYAATTRAQTRSIKGYIQIGKIALRIFGVVLLVSILIDQSPLLMISGLGALSAVLLLVFKDTLLSLVASTQLTSNDMLRIGDWIEMPQAGADGFVRDIALHTVKVQNWDNTVTTIPTYKLFSESYRNFRQMFESGGRRIKRTLRIDASSVRFLDDVQAERLLQFRLLHDYLEAKRTEIDSTNRSLGDLATLPANRRRMTNIGTFRAYALAFLKQHGELRQDMAMMVRMMEPHSEGIPVEVYCFTALTAWVEYERIQGDIFDHLLAILPELGLRLYQSPSGSDFSQISGRLRGEIDDYDAPPMR